FSLSFTLIHYSAALNSRTNDRQTPVCQGFSLPHSAPVPGCPCSRNKSEIFRHMPERYPFFDFSGIRFIQFSRQAKNFLHKGLLMKYGRCLSKGTIIPLLFM